MKSLPFPILIFAAAFLLDSTAAAQTGYPFQDESLRYSLNWPSGLSLGDASFSAHKGKSGWSFDVSVDLAVPGFPIADKYHSAVDPQICSSELERTVSHSGRKSRERTTFDQGKGKAHRQTLLPSNGGGSDFDIPSCGRDALAFVYYVRQEMGQGRVAPQQQVFFGSAYNVRLEYTGAQTIQSGDKQAVTDHVVAYVKGPKSDFSVEVFFARDAARTPLSVRIPLAVGTLSLELVR
jgi:hypothetical protein